MCCARRLRLQEENANIALKHGGWGSAIGALLAFVAAVLYGTNSACLRRGVLHGSASQAMSITVPLGVPLFLLAAWLSGQLFRYGRLPARSLSFFAVAGILHFVWGRYWNYRATMSLGSVGSGPVQQLQVLIAVALAVIFLDERLTALKITGILLIILGPIIVVFYAKRRNSAGVGGSLTADAAGGAAVLEPNPRSRANSERGAFRPRLLAGYSYALLAAIGYGITPVLIRAGLQGNDLGLVGGLIAYVAASVVLLIFTLLAPGQIRHVRSMDRAGVPWYLLSGVLVFFAQMLRFLALGLAPVTVVSPIQRLSLVARVVAGYFINRRHELLNAGVLAGVAVSLLGSAILGFAYVR